MPTYTYTCAGCAEQLEVVQRITDDPLTQCPTCSGTLRKVFQPVGVVFKGSGFYRNDSRSAPTKNGSTKSDKDTGTAAGKDSTDAGSAADTTAANGSGKDSSGSSGSSDSGGSTESGSGSTGSKTDSSSSSSGSASKAAAS